MSEIGRADCRTFTGQDVCYLFEPAASGKRPDLRGGGPADIYAIERTGQFSGRYFVLMGLSRWTASGR